MSANVVTHKPDPYDTLRKALLETKASQSTIDKAEQVIEEQQKKDVDRRADDNA